MSVILTVNPKTGAVGLRSHIFPDCVYLGYEYITVRREVAEKKYDVPRVCARCRKRFDEAEIVRKGLDSRGKV